MNTKVLYVSALCSKKIELDIVASKPNSIGLQIQKYHRLLVKGFVLNGREVVALSYNQATGLIPELPKKEEEDSIIYNYIQTRKHRKANYLYVLVSSFLKTSIFLLKNKNSYIVCDVLNLTITMGSLIAALIFRRKIIGIVTDLPEYVIENTKGRRICWWLIARCKAYVFLTENMTERINTKGRKYIVLEGHVDKEIEHKQTDAISKWQGKNCLDAGGLHKRYGIEKMVKAFQLAAIDNAVFHIYGDGDYAEELKKIEDKSIKCHGIVTNEEVVIAEKKATLLINPRPTGEEFTKFSFPSKNMEYMASGTPVLTTKLPGMPKEYKQYVYLFDDESIEGMARTLSSVLSLPDETLDAKGRCAQHFVLEKKNNAVQARKIIEMIE